MRMGLDSHEQNDYRLNVHAKDFKKMRRAKHYSQSQLAREFDITIQTISRWERGVVEIPRVVELALSALKPRTTKRED